MRLLGTLAALVLLLGSPVRAQMAESAGPVRLPEVDSLVADLASDDPDVSLAAYRKLPRYGERAVPSLIEFLAKPDPDRPGESVRGRIYVLLGKIGSPTELVLPALLSGLRDDSSRARQKAARAFGLVGAPAAVCIPALEEALQDSVRWVRLAAATSLGEMGSAGAAAANSLVDLLGDDTDEDLLMSIMSPSTAAYGALLAIGAPAAPALASGLLSDDELVRARSSILLTEIGPPAIPYLLGTLAAADDSDTGVLVVATLFRMGAPAADALRECQAVGDTEVREAASLCLRAIEEPGSVELEGLLRAVLGNGQPN